MRNGSYYTWPTSDSLFILALPVLPVLAARLPAPLFFTFVPAASCSSYSSEAAGILIGATSAEAFRASLAVPTGIPYAFKVLLKNESWPPKRSCY